MTGAKVTIEDQIRCVQRELAMRRVVYRRHPPRGTTAEHEIAAMAAVLDTLRALTSMGSALVDLDAELAKMREVRRG